MYIVLIIIQILVSFVSSTDTPNPSMCTSGDHCNICSSSNGMKFRADHDCIDCFDNMWYGFMIILLCFSVFLISMMIILFHAPMTYRMVSIWSWLQISAILFYRSSAEFIPIHQQWGFISTITIFSTSIWKSKCNSNQQWDQGTSFGILIVICSVLFFIFFCSSHLHHIIRHSHSLYHHKYYTLFINSLSVFEKRWQHQGKKLKYRNNDEDEIEDEHGSFVDYHNDDQSPQHPIPISQRPMDSNIDIHCSPTITPTTYRNKSQKYSKPTQNSAINKSNKISTHLDAPSTKDTILTPSSNLAFHTNTEMESIQYSSMYSSINDEKQMKKKKKRKKKSPKKKQITNKLQPHPLTLTNQITATPDTTTDTTFDHVDVNIPNIDNYNDYSFNSHSETTKTSTQHKEIKKYSTIQMDDNQEHITKHGRHKSISSMTEDHLPTINEMLNDDNQHQSDVNITISPKSPPTATMSTIHSGVTHEYHANVNKRIKSNNNENIVRSPPSIILRTKGNKGEKILKDEKAFEYNTCDPNQALSYNTYNYVIDTLGLNPIHSRSDSHPVTHSKKGDYPPQVDTLLSVSHDNANESPPKPPPLPQKTDADEHHNIDSKMMLYLRVHNAMLAHYTNTTPDGPQTDPNIHENIEVYLEIHNAILSNYTTKYVCVCNKAKDGCTTPDGLDPNITRNITPPSHSPQYYNITRNIPAMELDPCTTEPYHSLAPLQQRKEVPVHMAFNMTFLLCSPLILTESLSLFHCIEVDGILIRSRSQYYCSRDFWYYFGVFMMIGWFIYVLISIFKAKKFVKTMESKAEEATTELRYRNAYGDTFSFFWINNVKLNKWYYGFVPILLCLLIILCSVLFNDIQYAITMITLLLWFEFVIVCCVRPFLTASDRLCQFTLRTFILFQASIMIISIHDNEKEEQLEPVNVAICSVIFVTLIISYLAACSGLYPIHPNSTVCSSCCCCCFFCCLDPINDDDSDDEHYDDDQQHDDDLRMQLQILQQQLVQQRPYHQQLAQPNSNTPIPGDVGSDRPLLKQSAQQPTDDNNKMMQQNKNNKKDITMLSPQIQQSTNTITPYHRDGSSTNKQQSSNRFNFATAKHDGFTLPQNQHSFYKHYDSQTHTQTDDNIHSGTGDFPGLQLTDYNTGNSDNPHIKTSENEINLERLSSDDVVVIDDEKMKSFIQNVPSVSSGTNNSNQTQTQPVSTQPYYNKIKSNSRQYISTSMLSINSVESHTTTNSL